MHPISVTSNAIVIVLLHAFPFLIHKSINLRENKFYYYYYYYDGKGTFFMILECFYHFWPCERMRKHVFAGQNTQHWNFRFLFLSNISKLSIFSHHYTFLQSTIHVWTSVCSSPGTASYTFNWDKSSIITPAQWI